MNKFFTWIKNVFANAAKIFANLIKEALPTAKQLVIAALSDFAYVVVKELASGNLSSGDKQKEAFDRIKKEGIKEGLELKDSLVNFIIELVYQKFQSKSE